MTSYIPLAGPRPAVEALIDGLLAAGLSGAALAWRGRVDTGRAAAPTNAIAHWIWPRRAYRQRSASWTYTGTGAVIHGLSSMLWAGIYAWTRSRRRHPTVANAVTDAVITSGAAALVDLKLVPERLTPGFQHRLSRPSLGLVYAGVALGLAAGGLLALRR